MILKAGEYEITSWVRNDGDLWRLTLTQHAEIIEYKFSKPLINRRSNGEFNNPAGTYVIYMNKKFKLIRTEGKFNFVMKRGD